MTFCETIYVASSNAGKLRDFAVAAAVFGAEIAVLPGQQTFTHDVGSFSKGLYYLVADFGTIKEKISFIKN